jgi:hypothetical protein
MGQPVRVLHVDDEPDFAQIAAEFLDIIPNPLKSRYLVMLAGVTGIRITFIKGAKIKIAKNIETMVYGNYNYVTPFRQPGTLVHSRGTGTRRKSATVDPDHHRPFTSFAQAGSPDSKAKTVFPQLLRYFPGT